MEKPKSINLMLPSSSTIMLSSLMSQWNMNF